MAAGLPSIRAIKPGNLKTKTKLPHENPVGAGIVRNAEHYIYSIANDFFTGKEGFIKLELL